MKKAEVCINCIFAKLQLTDDKTDIDLDKSLVCIKNGYKLPLKKSYNIDFNGINQVALGMEVDLDNSCSNFIFSKHRKRDIQDGC